jgi:UDP-glucose 4-epimerase
MSRARVLVTGATGFVGRHLVRYLTDAGVAVVVAAREPERVPSGASEVIRWDLRQGRLPTSLLRDVSAVVHLAAYLPASYLDPGEASRCLEHNALGSLALVQSLVEAEVPSLVNVSSGNVYRDTTSPAREDAPAFPFRHAPYYLASKLVQEIFAEHLAERAGFRLVTLRPSAVYGPAMRGGMVHGFATRLLRGERVVVQDAGRYTVDLVYVDDVVRGVFSALERPVRGCFNLGSGERVSTLEVATLLAELTHAAPEQIEIEPAAGGAANGFAPLEISRARAELGHEPTPLRRGLSAYVSWLGAA